MITLKSISLRRGTKLLLDHANLSLNPGEKIGLVGRNGAGKSSVFALLNRQLQEDSGECHLPSHWRMAQVSQDMPETTQSATDFVIEGDSVLQAARDEVIAAENGQDGERMALAYMALNDAGEHDAVSRAQSLILGLGFKTSELTLPVNSFSGGWRMRLQLARALMSPSDLLLLDEPTNHLDLDALVWLETWLKQYPGTLLVISHDREFLDAVTQVTVQIDATQLVRYGGNYSKFEDLRAEQMVLQQQAFAKQQDKIAHLQKFIARFKAKASKAKQAQSRVKALERMEKIAPLLSEADFQFEFPAPAQLPNPMLALRQVSFGYPSADPPNMSPTVIVKDTSLSVLAGQRIGILGANGQGKSTVVKTIARNLTVVSGEITEGKGLNIGYFAQQELDVLQPLDSPLEHMMGMAKRLTQGGMLSGQSTREQDLRSFLGQFNFSGDMVKQAVGTMSGGEKARLVLCMLVWQRPNLLLLDEPTNHLDLATREALSVALNAYEGTVMLVSHDRSLLRAVCDEFWLVNQGRISPFDGDLDDYQRFLLDEAKRLKGSKSASSSETNTAQSKGAKPIAAKDTSAKPSLKQLQKSLTEIETHIQTLEAQREALHLSMSDAQVTASDLAQYGKQLKHIESELVLWEAKWLTLADEMQTALTAK